MAKQKLNQEQMITLAQLQVIAGTYSGLKTSFEQAKTEAKASKAKYDQLVKEVEELKANIEEEENDATRQTLRAELAKKKKDLEELEIDTTVKQATKQQLKLHIDESIEKMKELPGVREAIQEIVAKKYDTEIKKIGKEKEKEEKHKENLKKIAELTDEDKTENALDISDSFKDMLDAKNEIKKAKARIAEIDAKMPTVTDQNEQATLQQEKVDLNRASAEAQVRYQQARAQFISLSKGADVDFEEAEVDQIVTKVNDDMKRRKNRENDYDLGKVLQKQIARSDKKMESYDAQIAEYQKGKEASQPEKPEQGQPGEGIPAEVKIEKLHWWNPLQWKKCIQRKLEAGKEEEQQPEQAQAQPQQSDNSKSHKAFVRELQQNSTINTIINREMRETRDRVADVKRDYEENDK